MGNSRFITCAVVDEYGILARSEKRSDIFSGTSRDRGSKNNPVKAINMWVFPKIMIPPNHPF